MTKTILSAVLLLAVSSVRAEESLLYWMVTGSNIEFDYARVAATKGGETSYLSLWDDAEKKPVEGYCLAPSDLTRRNTDPSGDTWRSYMGGTTDWDGYSFCIELLMGDDAVVGQSGSLSYEALQGLNAIESTSKLEPMGSWMVSSFTNVPEPTSGLLSLIGLAALALRRRETV